MHSTQKLPQIIKYLLDRINPMTIPDYQSVILPLLNFISDGKEHSIREAYDFISDHFGLSEEERNELLPSGRQAIIDNRVGWAKNTM
jgi:restriction system protein